MKKSEMLSYIKSFMNDGKYTNYSLLEAEELLDMLEFQGMLPPARPDPTWNSYDCDGCDFFYYEWEDENEEK